MRAGGEAGTAPGSLATAVNGDALQLPFADSTFDQIIASEVLEHVSDDPQSLHEVFRVLKPGGTLASTVPSWLPDNNSWSRSTENHAPSGAAGKATTSKATTRAARLPALGPQPTAPPPPTTLTPP